MKIDYVCGPTKENSKRFPWLESDLTTVTDLMLNSLRKAVILETLPFEIEMESDDIPYIYEQLMSGVI